MERTPHEWQLDVIADALIAAAATLKAARAAGESAAAATHPPPQDDGAMRLLLSVSAAADRISISRTKMYELIADGTVPSVKIGDRRLVSARALEALVNEWIAGSASRGTR